MKKEITVKKTEKSSLSQEKNYIPEYALGEILVCFQPGVDVGRVFASGFGNVYGIKLKDQDDYFISNAYAYKTPIGKEEAACRMLSKKKDFIEWAKRRDLKLERRADNLEKLAYESTGLCDSSGRLTNYGVKRS
jgi:hypothetical protein